MLLPAAFVHAVVAAGPVATAAHCATLHAGGHEGCDLFAGDARWRALCAALYAGGCERRASRDTIG